VIPLSIVLSRRGKHRSATELIKKGKKKEIFNVRLCVLLSSFSCIANSK
jgi:hypothetical protein